MILNLYAIFDRCSGVYDGPHKARTDSEITRMFADLANDANHPIGKHPEDFTLFKNGNWNDATGDLVPQVPKKICNGAEVTAQNEEK